MVLCDHAGAGVPTENSVVVASRANRLSFLEPVHGFAEPFIGLMVTARGPARQLGLSPALGQDAALIVRGGGRMLRCSFFYEDFVKTVLTINTSWSSTCRMAAALVAEPGEGAFPGPDALLDYGEERLRERAKLGFRAATVVSATRRLQEIGAADVA